MDISTIMLAPFDFVWTKLVPFVVVLSVIVAVHEYGHYIVARWNRVKVEAFSIGFGPELFGWTGRDGTRWKVSAIPLGGYVRFAGDMGPASNPDEEQLARMTPAERDGSLHSKAVWQRALVAAAGPAANFILAIAIWTGLFATYNDVRLLPVVGAVEAEGAAAAAGLRAGDRVLAIDGDPVDSFYDLQRATIQSAGERMVYTVARGDERLQLPVTPRMETRTDRFGNESRMGMVGIAADDSPQNRVVTRLDLPAAFLKACERTWTVIESTFTFLAQLVTGKQDAKELRGPLGIGQITSQVATLGIAQLIGLAAVLSISIGILNLLPVPMLDGGHLVFCAIEAVRGRRVSERSQEIAFRIGFACVLMVMLFATTNDVGRIWRGFVS